MAELGPGQVITPTRVTICPEGTRPVSLSSGLAGPTRSTVEGVNE